MITESFTQSEGIERLEDIIQLGECLTQWEESFIDQMFRLDRTFTLPEHRKLLEIHERRVPQ